jgi:NosR/NirI family nitrous oxide reductase transcriptional regulator
MRNIAAAGVAVVIAAYAAAAAAGQPTGDARLQGFLKTLFRDAVEFSAKAGEPPHFTAFVKDSKSGQTAVAGFAFWTTELAPFERGYDGPIKMLVGMDTKGILTGVIVVEHHEPYGNISVDRPEFAAQFRNKSIRDAFTVGQDIDAVSRATITMTSAARAVKLSARTTARQLLADGPK